jgi:hypothetical protein
MKVPVGVSALVFMVNCWDEFALTVKGKVGLVVAPAGKPEIATDTRPVKPFVPTTEIVMGALPHPCIALTVPGESEIVKSGEAVGGVFGAEGDLPGVPQAARQAVAKTKILNMTRRFIAEHLEN